MHSQDKTPWALMRFRLFMVIANALAFDAAQLYNRCSTMTSSRKQKKQPVRLPPAKNTPGQSLRRMFAPVARYGFYIGAALPLIVAFFAYLYVFDELPDFNGDNLSYFHTGRALANGYGYVCPWITGAPPMTTYPPLYPAIIAVCERITPGNIRLAVIANGILFFGVVFLCYLLFGRLTGDNRFACVATVIIAANAHLLRFATMTMSEIPFLLFSTGAFLCIVYGKETRPWRDWRWYLLVLCLCCTYYTRTAGIAMIAGVIAAYLLSKKWRHALLTAAGTGGAALPWILWTRNHGGAGYLPQLMAKNWYDPSQGTVNAADLVNRVYTNVVRYIGTDIPIAFFPDFEWSRPSPATMWVAGLVVCLLIIYGLVRVPRYRLLVAAYLAGTAGMVLLWPEQWSGVRFILPVVPLLVFLALFGIYSLAVSAVRRLRFMNGIHPAVLLVFLFSSVAPLRYWHNFAAQNVDPKYKHFFSIAFWCRDNLPQDAVICCRKGELFYFLSMRPTWLYTFTSDPDRLLADFKKSGATHLLVDGLGYASRERYLGPFLKKYGKHFRVLIHLENPDTYLAEYRQ